MLAFGAMAHSTNQPANQARLTSWQASYSDVSLGKLSLQVGEETDERIDA